MIKLVNRSKDERIHIEVEFRDRRIVITLWLNEPQVWSDVVVTLPKVTVETSDGSLSDMWEAMEATQYITDELLQFVGTRWDITDKKNIPQLCFHRVKEAGVKVEFV